MEKSTIKYQLTKMIKVYEDKKANDLLIKGLSNSFEPSSNSIKNIMSFSDAYCYNKSDSLGEIEYLIN